MLHSIAILCIRNVNMTSDEHKHCWIRNSLISERDRNRSFYISPPFLNKIHWRGKGSSCETHFWDPFSAHCSLVWVDIWPETSEPIEKERGGASGCSICETNNEKNNKEMREMKLLVVFFTLLLEKSLKEKLLSLLQTGLIRWEEKMPDIVYCVTNLEKK